MDDRILIVKTSNRNIDYNSFLNFYDYDIEENVSLKKIKTFINQKLYKMVILDCEQMPQKIKYLEAIRKADTFMPVLLIVDSDYLGDIHQDIMGIHGLGPTEFAYHYEGEQFTLIHRIEKLLHPSLPTKREEVAVVIPVFNEEGRWKYVSNFLKKMKMLIDSGDYSFNVYIIDDGSKDTTRELIEEFNELIMSESDTIYHKNPLNLKPLTINTKKAGTYLEAFKTIDADYIVTIDADDSFNIEDLVKMLHIIRQGYFDMVIATKDSSMETRALSRKVMSLFKRILTKPFLPKGVTDSQTGLKIFTNALIHQMYPFLKVEYGLAFDLEMMYLAKKMRYRVKQIEVEIIDREGSHVELVKDTLRFLKTMLQLTVEQKYRKMM